MKKKNTEISSTYDILKETGKHGIIYGLTNILSTSITLLIVPLYTRFIPPSEYGILALIMVSISIITTVFNFGISRAFFRFYFDNKDDKYRHKLINTSFLIIIIFSIFSIICTFILSPILSKLLLFTLKYTYLFILLGIEGAFHNISQIGLSIFRVKRKTVHFSVFHISHIITNLGLVISLIIIFKLGIIGIITGKFVSSTIFLLIILFIFRKYIFKGMDYKLAKELIKFGYPFIFVNISSYILSYIDRIFLNYYKGLSDIGIYNIGYQIGSIIMILMMGPFIFIFAPMKYEVRQFKNADKYYDKVLLYLTFSSFLFFLFLSLLSKELIQLLIDRAYWSAYLIVPLIILGHIFIGLSNAVNLGIDIKKKPIIYFYIVSFTGLLNILLNFIIIPKYGMIGAAYTTFVSYAIMFLIYLIINLKLYYIDYNWKKFNIIFVLPLLLFLIGWFIPYENIFIILNLYNYYYIKITLIIIFKIIIILLYPIILWFFNIFTYEEKKHLKKLIMDSINKINIIKIEVRK